LPAGALGEHNFFRGGPLSTYEGEALEAIDALGDEIPRDAVMRVWSGAIETSWERDPVWVHGDVAEGNPPGPRWPAGGRARFRVVGRRRPGVRRGPAPRVRAAT
jgi:hypothetical protein